MSDLLKKYGVPIDAPQSDLLAKYGVAQPSIVDKATGLAKDAGMATLEGVAHVASLPMAAVGDLSSLGNAAVNKVAGTQYPVNNSYLLRALKGLIVPGTPIAGASEILGANAGVPEGPKIPGTNISARDAAGFVADVLVPGEAIAAPLSAAAKAMKASGSGIYKNAFRNVIRSAKDYKTGDPNRLLELFKESQVGKGAKNAGDVENQIAALTDKKVSELQSIYDAAGDTGKVDIAPGITQKELAAKANGADSTHRAALKTRIASEDVDIRNAALDELSGDLHPHFQSIPEEAKVALDTPERPQALAAINNFVDTLGKGPRSLSELRSYKQSAGRFAGPGSYKFGSTTTPKSGTAQSLGGAANDLLDDMISGPNAGKGSEFRNANKDVSTLIRAEKPLRGEVKKLEGQMKNTQLDHVLGAASLFEALSSAGGHEGGLAQALGLLGLLAAKKTGKHLNSLSGGASTGLGLLNAGSKVGDTATLLGNELTPVRRALIQSPWLLMGRQKDETK